MADNTELPFSPESLFSLNTETSTVSVEPDTPMSSLSDQSNAEPVTQNATSDNTASEPAVDNPKVKITDEDRDAFMRHILGAGRFCKTYTLRNNSMVVKLRTRTVAENDELYSVLADDVKAGKIVGTTASVDYLLRMYRLFLSASLISYSTPGGVTISPVGDTVKLKHQWLSAQLHETQLRLLLRCQEDFEYLVAALYREAVSQDFTADRAAVF